MYKLNIAKGIAGPAYIIVPLSESYVDKAVFNGMIRIVLGSQCAETQEEFDHVVAAKHNLEAQIVEALKKFKLLIDDPPTDKQCKQIEDYIASSEDLLVGYKKCFGESGPQSI